jgi:glycosyltransferase involved in cell wall biosynthesis
VKKLAIITTHPIQYNAPFFKMLAQRKNLDIKVFYTWSQCEGGNKYDPGFDKKITWDIPLLDGYRYCFVNNISKSPGSHHFRGIDNPTLIKEIQHWKADVILVYGWAFKSHLKAMRFFKGNIPILFRGDSTLLDQKSGIKKYLRNAFLKYIYSNINFAMYVGKANKAYFLAHGIKESQLFFMPHAIENERFFNTKSIQDNASKLLQSLKIPLGALVYLFSGKLETKKQPELLAKLVSELNKVGAHLIIAGSGLLEDKMKVNFANFENIHFVGFFNQKKMPILYAACNVFVLPSKGPGETWGLSINEAMASAKAVIVSDACGAASDLIEQSKNGFVFKKNNIEDLREKILFFINNRYAEKKMGENSLEIIKNYNYEKGCIILEEVVNNFRNKKL